MRRAESTTTTSLRLLATETRLIGKKLRSPLLREISLTSQTRATKSERILITFHTKLRNLRKRSLRTRMRSLDSESFQPIEKGRTLINPRELEPLISN